MTTPNFSQRFERSLIEMNDIRKGRSKGKTWRELRKEFKREREEKNMPLTEVKPIRPTKAVINKSDAQSFDNYANQTKKTESVGMNRMREMMNEFKNVGKS